MSSQFSVRTRQRTEMVDITGDVQGIVRSSGVRDGICVVCCPHTTAGITVNENADPSVVRDMLKETNKIVPFEDGYEHSEGNSAAHIKSSLFGASETFIVENGDLMLGTWQGIYFAEFDGPRTRNVRVQVIGS